MVIDMVRKKIKKNSKIKPGEGGEVNNLLCSKCFHIAIE